MSHALSFENAEASRAGPMRLGLKRSGDPSRGLAKAARVMRRRKKDHAPVRVPMLDWPSNLFGDNAGMAELMSEDFAFRCDPSVLSHGPLGWETLAQAAA